ncbi:MAG: hypothetical protein KJO42_15020 [Silicimonas sp.]|nr:hypothetical protein [Silicimonas sp.]
MTRAFVLASLAALTLAACYDDDTAHRSKVGPVEPVAQTPGDPARGYDALVNAPYVSCGIPFDAYTRVAPDAAPSDLPGRRGRNADLPYAATAHVNDDGVELVTSNCLTCHAAEIEGNLIVGLGNEFADFTADPRRLALRSGTYVRGAAETAAWQHWADRIEAIGPYVQTRTIGANPATNLTWALMSHLDAETLEWSDTPRLDPPPADPLPISVPPWWTVAKKNAMFYTTIGRGDHSRFMLLASMLCIGGIDDVEAIIDYAPDIRAYIASLEAPAWPWEIDTGLAAKGEMIYHRGCRECHGTYRGIESYPNLVIALDEIGTDPAYAAEATNGDRDRFYDWVERSPYGNAESAAPAPGYIAPPLDGVWATAPYLHNGSVPSMAALLESPLRPDTWRHTLPRDYDRTAMGWRFEALDQGQSAQPDPALRRRIYDTTFRGYGNGGHTYGDDLTDAERTALIEYLKTL